MLKNIKGCIIISLIYQFMGLSMIFEHKHFKKEMIKLIEFIKLKLNKGEKENEF